MFMHDHHRQAAHGREAHDRNAYPVNGVLRLNTSGGLRMRILMLLVCLAGVAGAPHASAQRELMELSAGGLSLASQTQFFNRASDQISRDPILRAALGPQYNSGYIWTARMMAGADLAALARSGLAIGPTLGELPRDVVAVVWSHPLKSAYWLVFTPDGRFVGAFALPEG